MPRSARRFLPPSLATLAACAALAAAAAPRAAAAQLLIDPVVARADGATATDLTPLLSDPDDGAVVRPFASAFTFYGEPRGSLVVSTNGYVTFGDGAGWARSADRTIGELADDVGPVVAPLYDDLRFDGSASLLELVAPGRYQAYTFADVVGFAQDPEVAPGRSTFQVAFFTGATRVGAVDFLAGDVAFSYGALGHEVAGRTATVGVGRDADAYTALPGSAGGEVADLAFVAGGEGAAVGGRRLVLLRPDTGNVVAPQFYVPPSPNVTVPEPSTVSLLVAGAGAVWAARRRRRA